MGMTSKPASNAVGGHHVSAALLTVAEAAQWLRIGKNLCYDLIARGEIPSIRLGSRIRVPRHALELWLARQAGIDLPASPPTGLPQLPQH
jgi:excisionase family DNA binding protein